MFYQRFAYISIAIAIMLGAMGAHALKSKIDADQLDSFKTGVLYHLIHGVALLAVCALVADPKGMTLWGMRGLILGPILFSGSIYLLATKDLTGLGGIAKVLGPITPIGGLIMIASWILLFFDTWKR